MRFLYGRPKRRAPWLVLLALWFFLGFGGFLGTVPAFSATVERGTFLERLWEARNLGAGGGGGKNGAALLLKSGLVPEELGNMKTPVTRREALRWSIQALGLGVEAEVLSGAAPFLRAALPAGDLNSLSDFERGCLLVVRHMTPALFKVQGQSFGPDRKLTPTEAGGILSAVAKAGKGLSLKVRFSPKPGMTLEIDRSGVATGIPKWRVLVDGFDEKEEVLRVKAALARQGFQTKESQPNYEWRLSSPLLDDYAQVRRLRAAAKGQGRTVRILPSLSNENLEILPLYRVLLTLDPNRFEMFPLVPSQGLSVLEPLSTMAQAFGADAAVNAGFFGVTGRRKGIPIGALKAGHVLLNKPYKGRSSVGWDTQKHALFGEVSWTGTVQVAQGWMELNAVNRFFKGDCLSLYTHHYGRPTPSNIPVTEVVVQDGVCTAVRDGGGTGIEPGTQVLAGYGNTAGLLSRTLKVGDSVFIDNEMTGRDGTSWTEMDHVLQAGPILLSGGEVRIEDEGFDTSLVRLRHPRSVVGLTKEGEWFFLVIDGRNGLHSVGASLAETAEFLKSRGVSYALNLDGGGSSELWVGGRLYNAPSDGWERPISNGLGARAF
ncbi:MAG: phosphodiester glycosidase family protein [Fretibacterium sp.]|nr:phosphodiester glycosidase family protein [Fretibacterium sp.]